MKLVRLGNSAWDFLGLIFGLGICSGFVVSLRDFFGFHFCPHSIIPSLEIRSTPIGLYYVPFTLIQSTLVKSVHSLRI